MVAKMVSETKHPFFFLAPRPMIFDERDLQGNPKKNYPE